jgi:hypothetical protein
MILGWSPFKTVSVGVKIEISSNVQNCSILSQKVPKFELYQHNEELFNIYYGIFLRTLNFWTILTDSFERGPSKDHFSKVWLRLAQ